MLDGFLESLFPSRKLARLSFEEKLRREQMMTQFVQRELHEAEQQASIGSRSPLSEDTTSMLGNPWQVDVMGLSLDQAWKQGFPTIDNSYYFADEAFIAHDDSLRNLTLRLCRHLYAQHPHAKGMVEACVSFVCGQHGWTVEPCPKKLDYDDDSNVQPVQEDYYQGDAGIVDPVAGIVAPVDINPEDPGTDADLVALYKAKAELDDKPLIDTNLQRKLRRLWMKYVKRGQIHPQLGWTQFWKEAYRRTRRDGECFIWLGNNPKDGALTPRFIDPLDIQHPTMPGGGANTNTIFDPKATGVEVDPDDPSQVLAYWYRRHDRIGQEARRLPADRVIHIKYGVDSTIKRGLPMLFVCRNFLRHFDLWISQSLKHQKVQTLTAVLRQWDNAPEALLQTMADNASVRRYDRTTPAGNNLTYRTQDFLPVVDAPAGMKMTYTAPNGNYGDSEILARRVLLACAVGVNLSEAMVTADGSNANYASTRITQFIPLRAFEGDQGEWSETIEGFYKKWVYAEAAVGRVPRITDDCQLDANVTPTKLPDFEGEIASQTIIAQYQAGLIDRRTALEKLGYDPDTIEERLHEEDEELSKKNDAATNALMGQQPMEAQPVDLPPEEQPKPGQEVGGDTPAPDKSQVDSSKKVKFNLVNVDRVPTGKSA